MQTIDEIVRELTRGRTKDDYTKRTRVPITIMSEDDYTKRTRDPITIMSKMAVNRPDVYPFLRGVISISELNEIVEAAYEITIEMQTMAMVPQLREQFNKNRDTLATIKTQFAKKQQEEERLRPQPKVEEVEEDPLIAKKKNEKERLRLIRIEQEKIAIAKKQQEEERQEKARIACEKYKRKDKITKTTLGIVTILFTTILSIYLVVGTGAWQAIIGAVLIGGPAGLIVGMIIGTFIAWLVVDVFDIK
jgi:hypothetical protein